MPYYSEHTATLQVMHMVYYSETLHMEDRCLYAILLWGYIHPVGPIHHLAMTEAVAVVVVVLRGKGGCVCWVGGSFSLTLLHSQSTNKLKILESSTAAVSDYKSLEIHNYDIMLPPLDRSNPKLFSFFFCTADPL